MIQVHRLLIVPGLIASFTLASHRAFAESNLTTRISDAKQHHRQGSGWYPYRAKSDYILRELDLQAGDVVVDVGAGDGWWAEKFAKPVGKKGVIHAAEVENKKVDQMKKRFAKTPQVKPYLIKTDSTGLPGTMTGPLSPPFNNRGRLSINSPAFTFFARVLWHL